MGMCVMFTSMAKPKRKSCTNGSVSNNASELRRNQKIRLAMPLPENREPFGKAFPAGAPHDVADKENPHRIRRRYFAYSVARVSLLTVTLICPGYFISSSIFRAISNASLCTSPSSVIFGETTTRTSRPA